jgi:hypothetical protein
MDLTCAFDGHLCGGVSGGITKVVSQWVIQFPGMIGMTLCMQEINQACTLSSF